MEKIIEMLPDGWCVDFTCYGVVGFDFNLYQFGRCVLTCYDLDTFIKQAQIVLAKEHLKNV